MLWFNSQRGHEALISAILALSSTVFQQLAEVSSTTSLSEAFAHPDLAQLSTLIVRVTTVAILDLSLPPQDVSLFSPLSTSGMYPAALGAILEHQTIALEGLSSPDASASAAKVIEDALVVYNAEVFPVRRVR